MQPSLSQIAFFEGVPAELIAAADAEVEWLSIPAGYPLAARNEPAECLWFVLSGTLGAFAPDGEGGLRLMGYVRAGEPVGEMAIMADEPRSADLYAIRDSELLRLPKDAFLRLIEACPKLMRDTARTMLARARGGAQRQPRAEPRIFALISASPTIDLDLRARALKASLEKRGISTAILGPECEDMLATELDRLERSYGVVLLYSPIADSTWFRACLRQADRIWILARMNARPSTPLLPEDRSPARQFRLVDIVLIHHGADRQAASVAEWRAACEAHQIYHWRDLDEGDADRLARTICGQAIALVLSGGGARAYAHIGVVRALREARIPIDAVGGASMGAIVAACVAIGWSDDEIEMRIRRAFVESNPLGDYVLPVVALVRGKRVEDRLQEHFGEALIEDLRTPFFCVSTNLCSGSIRLHDQGLLRHALRASISLPGILPPVVEGGQGLLVDGAVLNNFPVDVMRGRHRGPIVGVDVARRGVINPNDFVDPPQFFGWVMSHGLQSAPPIASLLMRAATVSVDPWAGRRRTDLLMTPEMADIDLRDWKQYDDAVAAGYEAAVAAIQNEPIARTHARGDRAHADPAAGEAAAALALAAESSSEPG